MYEKIGKRLVSHQTVDHTASEYSRCDVTTNTVEGFFDTIKMDIRGVYQHVSPEHLGRYIGEFRSRYKSRVALEISLNNRDTSAAFHGSGSRRHPNKSY